ncbi:MAG: cell division protein FtsA [Gemmataceae bacterium]|nr:cell division protein FtsA [Gemmataceae bacterium]
MKTWKDLLADIKKALRGLGRVSERGERLHKTDFVPPPAWSTDEGSPSAKSLTQNPTQKTSVTLAVDTSTTQPPARTGSPQTPMFGPRIDGGRSPLMPEWAGIGRLLQHPENPGGNRTPMTVRVGIDFGTAFTKVAIRAGPDLVPIEWSAVTGDHSETGRYLIPGFVVRAPDGEFCWRRLDHADVRGNLKLPVIDQARSDVCPIEAVAFLALVIRYARAFLYGNADIGQKLKERSLRWELNIGCPTEPHENPEVVETFRHIARAAWRLAGKERIHEDDVLAAWSSTDTEIGLETEPGVVPEFVAQIAGYLKSRQKREGLHALIDIGAATLDVATFNIVFPNDHEVSPCIPIFFSAVRPLGTHYLRHDRHSRLGLALSWNDAAPVETADDFAREKGISPQEVTTIDDVFTKRVAECIFHVLDSTRTNARGYPQSPAWREGLPLFITGGAADCPLYRRAIDCAEKAIRERSNNPDFRFIELLHGEQHPVYEAKRINVAVGLTEDAESIARIVPHRDIERIERPVRPRVDHEELYGDG